MMPLVNVLLAAIGETGAPIVLTEGARIAMRGVEPGRAMHQGRYPIAIRSRPLVASPAGDLEMHRSRRTLPIREEQVSPAAAIEFLPGSLGLGEAVGDGEDDGRVMT
jgi:hypothetical protein